MGLFLSHRYTITVTISFFLSCSLGRSVYFPSFFLHSFTHHWNYMCMNCILFYFNRRVCWSVHSIICCTADNIFYFCWSSHIAKISSTNNTIIIKRKQIQIEVGISASTKEKKGKENQKSKAYFIYTVYWTVNIIMGRKKAYCWMNCKHIRGD